MNAAAAKSTDSAPRLSALSAAAASRVAPNPGFGGDVTPGEAFEFVARNAEAMLVDVRTDAEWKWVGQPDLSGAAGKAAFVSMKLYPSMELNAQFLQQLEQAGATQDTALFFMCRGGGRSTMAAKLATQAGYKHCFNIAGGFEGVPDERGHLGNKTGWKAEGLPWRQS